MKKLHVVDVKKNKIAIVYDRVNKWGGAERVLLALHEIFPDAPLFTAVYDENKAPWASVFPKVIPSFLNKIPFAKNNHEFLGLFTPFAFESFGFDDYDLVISVTSEAAKGIITKPQSLHICICLTPTRYLWSGYEEYRKNVPKKLSWIPFYRQISGPIINYLRKWDRIAAQRPDEIIAISHAVQNRIKKYYDRESDVVYPPVNLDRFKTSGVPKKSKDEYFLFVSRLIPYKKADLAIKAFNKLNRNLVVIGEGSEEKYLKKLANKNIKFVKNLSDDELANYYQNAKALIFPGEEDFGIVMVETLASGTPVIAYGKGGVLDIVKNGKTGLLFRKQSVESLINVVNKFDNKRFDRNFIVKSVETFSEDKFQTALLKLIKDYVLNYNTL